MIFNALRKRMKIVIYVVVIAFALGTGLFYLNYSGSTNQEHKAYAQDPKGPIATVNGEDISYQQFAYQLNQYLRKYQNKINSSQVLGLKFSVLNNIIDNTLVVQQVKEKGYLPEISDKEVEEQLNKMIKQYANSKEEFSKLLAENGTNIDEVRVDIKEGLTQQKGMQQLLEDIKNKAEVAEDEIVKKYEEVTASHILIKVEGRSDNEAEVLAKEVMDKAKDGEDFAKLAKEYSEGPSAKNGGQLGSFHRGDMVPTFEEKAFSMRVGEISQPVKTQFGYHIIKVTDKKRAEGEEYNKQKTKIKEELLKKREKEEITKWLKEVKDKSQIVINDEEISAFNQEQSGNYEEAITGYKTALANSPNAYYLYYNLAQSYIENNQQDQAISVYQEAVNKYPEQVDFYNKLAGLYQKQDKNDEAIKLYKKGIENNKDNTQLHLGLGRVYQNAEKQDQAVKEYEKFSQLSGDNIMAHYRLATLYNQMGLKDKAESEMKKVKEIQAKQREESKKIKNSEQENNKEVKSE